MASDKTHIHRHLSLRERFNLCFTKTDNCWLWTGTVSKEGYGRFALKGKLYAAHRVSYQLYKGEIPESLVVRHTCDDRLCVNPEHLLLGTHEQNSLDASERQRYQVRTGSKNPSAKLTEEQVNQIKTLLSSGSSIAELAGKFNISTVQLYRIRSGKRWVGRTAYRDKVKPHPNKIQESSIPLEDLAKTRSLCHKMTIEDAHAVRQMRAEGKRVVDIANLYEMSQVHIYNILKNKVWPE